MDGCNSQIESLLFDWKLHESFFVSQFRSVRSWLPSNNRFAWLSHYTRAWSGETKFTISQGTASYFESKAKRSEVFHRNFEYSPTRGSRCLHFLYSTCSREPDTSLRCRRYAVEAKFELSWTQNKLSSPLCRKSTRTQAQLHTLGVKVDLSLASEVFPRLSQTARLRFRSQQTECDILQSSCAIDDMATGRPCA